MRTTQVYEFFSSNIVDLLDHSPRVNRANRATVWKNVSIGSQHLYLRRNFIARNVSSLSSSFFNFFVVSLFIIQLVAARPSSSSGKAFTTISIMRLARIRRRENARETCELPSNFTIPRGLRRQRPRGFCTCVSRRRFSKYALLVSIPNEKNDANACVLADLSLCTASD